MKKNIIFSILLLSLIMLSVTALPTSATDYTKVGVKVGDTAYYIYSNPGGNGIIQIYVQQITGTNVTLNIKTIAAIGSVTPDNIVTGNLSATINFIFPYLVASNLSQGDSAMPGSQHKIDKTTTMNIAGLNRIVNHLSYSLTLNQLNGSHYYFDAYWDKTTGLGTKSNITYSESLATAIGIQAGSYIMNLISTTAFNTWTTIDPTTLLIIAGGVATIPVATVIAVFALENRKRQSPNRADKTHQHPSPKLSPLSSLDIPPPSQHHAHPFHSHSHSITFISPQQTLEPTTNSSNTKRKTKTKGG